MGLFSAFQKRKATPGEIVSAFGQLLENGAPAGGCVADTNELPFPKDQIRAAILTFITTGGDAGLQEKLGQAYVMLASWQDGVGPRHRGVDLLGQAKALPPLDIAKYVLAESEAMKRWAPLIEAEQRRLLADLTKL